MTASRMEVEQASRWELRFGSRPHADGSTEFRVWAPLAKSLEVKLVGEDARAVSLEHVGGGMFEARVGDVCEGVDYFYVVNGNERPDPVSRSQPAGVHGPSRVVAPDAFEWADAGWRGIALKEFVVCIQNHDQIANAYWGDRLSRLLRPEQQRLAAAILLCGAPNVPMLFMGEEWSERAPFLYFTSHTDKELGRAVRRCRMKEYDSFVRCEGETESTLGGFVDPQSEITFVRSKLDRDLLTGRPHAEMLAFYRDALLTRRTTPALSNCDKSRTRVRFDEDRRLLTIERGDASGSRATLLCNLSDDAQAFTLPEGSWRLALWTHDAKYGGDVSKATPRVELDADAQNEIQLAAWGAALYIKP